TSRARRRPLRASPIWPAAVRCPRRYRPPPRRRGAVPPTCMPRQDPVRRCRSRLVPSPGGPSRAITADEPDRVAPDDVVADGEMLTCGDDVSLAALECGVSRMRPEEVGLAHDAFGRVGDVAERECQARIVTARRVGVVAEPFTVIVHCVQC